MAFESYLKKETETRLVVTLTAHAGKQRKFVVLPPDDPRKFRVKSVSITGNGLTQLMISNGHLNTQTFITSPISITVLNSFGWLIERMLSGFDEPFKQLAFDLDNRALKTDYTFILNVDGEWL